MKVPFIKYVQGRNAYPDADQKHYGWAIHNTSNTATAAGEASYATRRTDGVSSHFYHDKVEVIQSLDTNSKAGHAGSSTGNNNALCSEITGLNSWTRAQWLASVNWDETGEVIAYTLTHDPDFVGFQIRRASVQEMKDNPKVKAFYSHDDMRRAWGGTTHTDPGSNFPWDKLFASVNKYLGGDMADYTEAQMKAFTWQYNGRGIGENNGTTIQKSTLEYFNEVLLTTRLIAKEVNIDPDELLKIQAAAKAGAEAAMEESMDEFVAGVVAGIKAEIENLDLDGPTTEAVTAACEQGVRNVLLQGVDQEE
jgi:N-acetyl-anhydromuramyl-L-alanine amidase AmpD